MSKRSARKTKKPKPKRSGRCPRCAQLEARIRELENQVRELRELLRLNSENSSIPPSKDPLHNPSRPSRTLSNRKRGAQPGHKGSRRELLPVADVDDVISHVPSGCAHCGEELHTDKKPSDPPPARHQVYELSERPFTITEHQTHGRTCASCGKTTRAEFPSEHSRAFGPRLVALVAMLTGSAKLSRRASREIVEDGLGIPMSLGALSESEAEISAALADSHVQIAAAVREAPQKNADETSWKLAGKKRWLWAAATQRAAYFLIRSGRGKAAFRDLLGRASGIVTSDRYHVYNSVAKRRRQVCWAHLKRDFTRLSEKEGRAGILGAEALEVLGHVFMLWHDFRDRVIDRDALRRCVKPNRDKLRAILREGENLDLPKVSTFCMNLLELEPALWTFVRHDGVEPTNNHAERVLRPAVVWRKRSFGANSERGCRYVERILTASATCRLQARRISQFLFDALLAHRTGCAGPSLLATG